MVAIIAADVATGFAARSPADGLHRGRRPGHAVGIAGYWSARAPAIPSCFARCKPDRIATLFVTSDASRRPVTSPRSMRAVDGR